MEEGEKMSHRPRLISFQLVTDDNSGAEITLNPTLVESIVDGKPFKHGETTQINMTSGCKFFVACSYNEVKETLKYTLGV